MWTLNRNTFSRCTSPCHRLWSVEQKLQCFRNVPEQSSIFKFKHTESGHKNGRIVKARQIMNRTAAVLSVLATGTICVYFYIAKNNRAKPLLANEQHSNNRFYRDLSCQGKSGILLYHNGFWLPYEMFKDKRKIQEIKDFPIHKGDVIVASFPKSGTTWVQAIVSLIMSVHSDNVNNSGNTTIEDQFPYIEYVYPGLRSLTKICGPRCMKTHMPLELLPQDLTKAQGKVIYIARNPKDVAVSYYHFVKMLTFTKYQGEFEDFYNSFKEGKVPYGPWPTHVLQFWENRDKENILFLTYEDLHKDPKGCIHNISRFLGKTLTDSEVAKIKYLSSFHQMSKDSKMNYSWWDDLGIRDKTQTQFMRKGQVGDWQSYFSQDMIRDLDKTCLEPLQLKGLNLTEKL